jgi:hypothetical protein
MKTLELEIFRKYKLSTYTIGRFTVDGGYKCDTIEDPIRDLNDYNHDNDFDDSGEGKIYGKTAIPCGRYRVLFTYSMKLKRSLPILQNVPGFTGIRIHGGKNADWSEGCPLVGENKIKGGLVNYKYWETVISNLIRDAINRGEQVWITIKQ